MTRGGAIVEQGKTRWYYNPRGGGFQRYPQIAYHLLIEGFQGFLSDRCEANEIELTNDRIEEADTSGRRIERVQGRSQQYEADLYIDASGFDRAIRSEFPDLPFVEFDISLDRAARVGFERCFRS